MKVMVAGTTNRAKIALLRDLLSPEIDLIAPPVQAEMGFDEVGDSFVDIAMMKARAWSSVLGRNDLSHPVVVTDGGLVMPALGDRWDPRRTHRFAGSGATALARSTALLQLAAGLRGAERTIGWTEAVVVVSPDGRERVFTAESPPGLLAESVGTQVDSEQNGFWIPNLWLCPEFGLRRLSELTPTQRGQRRDHWHIIGEELRRYALTLAAT